MPNKELICQQWSLSQLRNYFSLFFIDKLELFKGNQYSVFLDELTNFVWNFALLSMRLVVHLQAVIIWLKDMISQTFFS